jgi:hypothetical protein
LFLLWPSALAVSFPADLFQLFVFFIDHKLILIIHKLQLQLLSCGLSIRFLFIRGAQSFLTKKCGFNGLFFWLKYRFLLRFSWSKRPCSELHSCLSELWDQSSITVVFGGLDSIIVDLNSMLWLDDYVRLFYNILRNLIYIITRTKSVANLMRFEWIHVWILKRNTVCKSLRK